MEKNQNVGTKNTFTPIKEGKKLLFVLKNLLQNCGAFLNGKSIQGWGKLRQDTAHQ